MSSTPNSPEPASDDEANAELPMTMAASVVLENLPRDAHKALETAGELDIAKGNRSHLIRLHELRRVFA
jgi:ubiquitin-like protein ATG12